MENLVKSCKILFDKTILDDYSSKYIFYKNIQELEILKQKFKQDLPNILNVNEVPYPVDITQCQLKPQYVRELFESKLTLSINNLTKNSNSKFVNDTVNVLLNNLIGQLVALPYNETNYLNEYVRIREYNNQIKPAVESTINTILFGHRINGHDSRIPIGLLYRKARFKCVSCGINYSIAYDSDCDSLCGDGEQYCQNCDT